MKIDGRIINKGVNYVKEDVPIEEFADFVRFMRKSIGLSQEKFGDAVGVTTASVCRWEKGVRKPKELYEVIENIRYVVKERIRKRRLFVKERIRKRAV